MVLSTELSTQIGRCITGLLAARTMQDFAMRDGSTDEFWMWVQCEKEMQTTLHDLGIPVEIRMTKTDYINQLEA